MDIQVSSNFERLLFEVHGRDPNAVRRLMAEPRAVGRLHHRRRASWARSARNSTPARPARRRRRRPSADTLAETGELLDPHTAVGYAVARQAPASASPMVTLATAHPAKFPDAVEKASGVRPGLPRA